MKSDGFKIFWLVLLYTAVIVGIFLIYDPFGSDMQTPASNSTFVYQNF